MAQNKIGCVILLCGVQNDVPCAVCSDVPTWLAVWRSHIVNFSVKIVLFASSSSFFLNYVDCSFRCPCVVRKIQRSRCRVFNKSFALLPRDCGFDLWPFETFSHGTRLHVILAVGGTLNTKRISYVSSNWMELSHWMECIWYIHTCVHFIYWIRKNVEKVSRQCDLVTTNKLNRNI